MCVHVREEGKLLKYYTESQVKMCGSWVEGLTISSQALYLLLIL